ncbi:rcc01693 family protein [Aquamicrobium zhengzhouense]|uniref:Phage tail assembly chaperone n=1 Tax=Aquamicrobium zhengzhouense TaxID=2781738 RepID=A0ABS0SBV4_9HYPH|nr:rcc01693 family protein [Aquamicrobium zhengzhouense]MBI1620752.1 phage tail assembly chaperone [Aquamicrobium zhengzhouense]
MSAATGNAHQFPWDAIIALGLGLLRLPPRAFWAMTPKELSHALRFIGGNSFPPTRSAMAELMRIFPDDQGA